jgi:hypothetical protein
MSTSRRIGLAIVLVGLALVPLPALAQGGDCPRQVKVRVATDVYDRPPVFYTADG